MSVLERCPSYIESTKGSKERQGPTLGVRLIEVSVKREPTVICGIIYRQHNSPEVFQTYFGETVEKFAFTNKTLYRMGDLNEDLLKCETSHFSHNFLIHLQSCYLIATVNKPTRVHAISIRVTEALIFVNNPDKILACGNIILLRILATIFHKFVL